MAEGGLRHRDPPTGALWDPREPQGVAGSPWGRAPGSTLGFWGVLGGIGEFWGEFGGFWGSPLPVRGLQGPGARPCVWGLGLCGWGRPRARLCPELPAGDKGEGCGGAALPFVGFYKAIKGLGVFLSC